MFEITVNRLKQTNDMNRTNNNNNIDEYCCNNNDNDKKHLSCINTLIIIVQRDII